MAEQRDLFGGYIREPKPKQNYGKMVFVVVNEFKAYYKKMKVVDPFLTPRDWKLTKAVVKLYGLKKAMYLVKMFFEGGDAYWWGDRRSFLTFYKAIPTIVEQIGKDTAAGKKHLQWEEIGK